MEFAIHSFSDAIATLKLTTDFSEVFFLDWIFWFMYAVYLHDQCSKSPRRLLCHQCCLLNFYAVIASPVSSQLYKWQLSDDTSNIAGCIILMITSCQSDRWQVAHPEPFELVHTRVLRLLFEQIHFHFLPLRKTRGPPPPLVHCRLHNSPSSHFFPSSPNTHTIVWLCVCVNSVHYK